MARCVSCAWCIERLESKGWGRCCKKNDIEIHLLDGGRCKIWQARGDCKKTIFLCSEYYKTGKRSYKKDIFEICKKCL